MKYELGPLRILLCPSVRPSVCPVRNSKATAKIRRKIIYIYISIVVPYTRLFQCYFNVFLYYARLLFVTFIKVLFDLILRPIGPMSVSCSFEVLTEGRGIVNECCLSGLCDFGNPFTFYSSLLCTFVRGRFLTIGSGWAHNTGSGTKFCHCRPISCYISKALQETDVVTMKHQQNAVSYIAYIRTQYNAHMVRCESRNQRRRQSLNERDVVEQGKMIWTKQLWGYAWKTQETKNFQQTTECCSDSEPILACIITQNVYY